MRKPLLLIHALVLFALAISASMAWVFFGFMQPVIAVSVDMTLDPANIVVSVLIGTAIILLISRLFRKTRITAFKILFILALFGGVYIFLSAFVPALSALAISFALIAYRMARPSIFIHNVVMALGASGVGAILGVSFTVANALIVLGVLSLYDVIAVYFTRHMVYMATQMIEANAFLGFIIPESMSAYRHEAGLARPGQGFMFLGGGDIVLPMIFIVSAFSVNVMAAMASAIGALAGIAANHYILMKTLRPLPALPFIALGAIAFFYLSRLLLL